MRANVDLYNNAYEKYEMDVYREVREETYGVDLGQTSWVTQQESIEIPELLEIASGSKVLEIGCGSGRYALDLAHRLGCRILGVDVNPRGIATANELARGGHLAALARFEECDVSGKLPFEDEAFDAVFANDVLCHISGRGAVLGEAYRVLRPGGRLLFSDALVVGGLVSHEEIATRSMIGYYIFSPPRENERLIQAAGFRLVSVTDTSQSAAALAARWRDARESRKKGLIAVEGENNFDGLQRFLSCVHILLSEKRLLRNVYLACKDAKFPSTGSVVSK